MKSTSRCVTPNQRIKARLMDRNLPSLERSDLSLIDINAYNLITNFSEASPGYKANVP
jgi:hypothetical protein